MSTGGGRIKPDKSLTARMTLTIFLLGALYVGVMAILIASGVNAGLVIVIAVIVLFAQYWFSDRIALYAMHGKIVTAEEAPELHGIVDRLCALADMPKPTVAIARASYPNAFATGRSPKRAVVCVTSDIMARLDTEELEGVLSHELSHVAHRDVAVMTVASFLGVAAGLVTRFAFYSELFGGGGFGGGRGNNNNNQNGAAVMAAVMLVSIVVYAISFLLTRALSRYRELAADRSGAILTGRPSALASALQKVSGDLARIPTHDLRSVEPFNAFFFSPALANGVSISSLFSTHPSLEKRLEQLARISVELGQPA
jgi:heat shock protein HtpX